MIKYTTQKGINNPTTHYLFVTWRMMNVRCYDEKHKAYHRYGGRGITVCSRWRWDNPKGFLGFIQDVGDRPDGKTLDRKDNNKNYCKTNCRWATKREQQNNMSIGKNNSSGIVGVKIVNGRYEVSICLNNKNTLIGIYTLDEKEQAKNRYEEIKKIKLEKSDCSALEYLATLDKLTPTNKRLRINKTSKFYGVSWDKEREKWRAMTSYRETEDGKLINKMVGRFNTEEEAYEAILLFLKEIKEFGYYKKIK